jgi:hypothetical protein
LCRFDAARSGRLSRENESQPVEKAITMATSLLIEHDHGTYSGTVRGKHQGYYAGDFRTQPAGHDSARAAMGDQRRTDVPPRASTHLP